MNKKYSIVGICQVYNELRKGNLKRFIKYAKPLVDALVFYDDGSTDGSYEYELQHTPYVIREHQNDYTNERTHRKMMLDEALKLSPDFILWLDADEVMTANAADKLQELCAFCEEKKLDALRFHELNLWRSNSWRRIDSLFDDGWFIRLWRVTPEIAFHELKPGLHQNLFPDSIDLNKVERANDVQVLHYGFSSKKRLAYKYLVYQSHGLSGYEMLDRMINEDQLVLEKVPAGYFPEGLWVDDPAPQKIPFAEALAYVEEYRQEVFKPGFSIICPIAKNLAWLKFIHHQVSKYTDLSDKEFFFVAGNDSSKDVLSYLSNNSIPHYILDNTENQKEWFSNNIYCKYNLGASKARGDFLVFLYSDMALSPNWFNNLWKAYNGTNCLSPRIVEAERKTSGQYKIEQNFGKDYDSYQENDFQKFVSRVASPNVKDGGFNLALLIRKEHFDLVGGFPEGNVITNGNISQPVTANHNKLSIANNQPLISKLASKGIVHQTVFNSLIYHFQDKESGLIKEISPHILFVYSKIMEKYNNLNKDKD